MTAVTQPAKSETENIDENNSPVLVYTGKVRELTSRYCQRMTRLFEETFYNKPGPLDQQYVWDICIWILVLCLFIY